MAGCGGTLLLLIIYHLHLSEGELPTKQPLSSADFCNQTMFSRIKHSMNYCLLPFGFSHGGRHRPVMFLLCHQQI